MATIWVPKDAGHDFRAASQFGEVQRVFSDTRLLFDPPALAEWAKIMLKDATEEDYLLLSGPPLMNCVVFDTLVGMFGAVRLLLFHARENTYRERVYRSLWVEEETV